MSFLRWINANHMALAVLALWCCSLLLPVFYTTARNDESWLGLLVLLTGWLGPLALNFGWYANIFFFFIFFLLLLSEQTPVKSILLAVLLALDSFRFSHFSVEPGSSPVYGYGWGMLLWFLAIFLLLAAVGKRQRELTST